MKTTLKNNIKEYAKNNGYKVKYITEDDTYVSVAFIEKSVNRTAFVCEYRIVIETLHFELINFYPMFSNGYLKFDRLMKLGMGK